MMSCGAPKYLLCACAIGAVVVVPLATVHAQGTSKGAAAAAPANTPSGPPNALQGFAQNRDRPIRVDAERLEVRDKEKVATFFGDARADVKVVQGDTTMRSRILVVFYEQDEKSGAGEPKAASSGPGGSSQIKRLEAKDNVVVTQKDQTVTGEKGVFDMKANTVTMSGNVVMTQCESVLRGDRLIVDLTTGVSRVEGGRVQGILVSGCGATTTTTTTTAPPAKR
jgi:lipopolysaccharide export system protein LptA